jgi:ABC-type transport system involved in multi-copper enzyme maturation permease subunit
VTDRYYLVHQPLVGDGSITARVTSLTGLVSPGGFPKGGDPLANARSGVQPWAKAGLIATVSTAQGSAYAAIMTTGAHGVRMQYNYTHDRAGSSSTVSPASPQWLRLTRSGDTLTGYESEDGKHWTEVGTAHLSHLPSTVQAGMFVTSPEFQETTQSLGGSSTTGGPTRATARFDHVTLNGHWPRAAWAGYDVGVGHGVMMAPSLGGSFSASGGTFTVSGSGDIAPMVEHGATIEETLVGAFAGLIVLVVVGTMFITGEYRRGLIRLTLAASPRRGRVLAAKAVVVGAVGFAVGLAAAAVVLPLGEQILRSNGNDIYPVSGSTELRVVVGTAALLAVAAVLALALGTVMRRSLGAVAAVVVLLVLPYLFAVANVLPVGAAQWLLRVTPAAAFAIQQSVPEYSQVNFAYTPSAGYFPLAPWAGFSVLVLWTAAALALATFVVRRRDA